MHANGMQRQRWWVVLGAILIQLCLGVIYAWSVFTPDLVTAGWTKTQTQVVFSTGLAFFAISMVAAGRKMTLYGPRKLAMGGGLVLGLGYLLAGISGGTGFWAVLVGVGIIGGTGIGMAYVVPVAVGMRWFPDRKGLITGLAVAGFGFGAMLWVKLAGNWGHLLNPGVLGLAGTFSVYGILFLGVIMLGGYWMVYPPEGWQPQGRAARINRGTTVATAADLTSAEMLKTVQYYLILITFACGASAGLMTIGLMKLFPMQALAARGVADPGVVAGTAMAVFFSLANGLGRIAWGWISDRLGRKRSITVMLGTQGIMVILFQWMAGTPALLYLGATLIGFNFGGNFALFPTMTADTFGSRHVGQNYGWVFLAYGLGGITGPILGGRLGDLENFPLAFTICGILCLLAALIIVPVAPARKSG